MNHFEFSSEADFDLDEYLSFVIERDGIDRASNLYDKIMKKIQEVADAPFEIGQRKDGYIVGLRKVIFKRLKGISKNSFASKLS